MNTDLTQAREALQEVEKTQKRTRTLSAYQYSSVYFILCGVILFLANGLIYFLPGRYEGMVWLVLGPVGFVASMIAAMRGRGHAKPGWRYPASVGALVLFVISSMVMLRPVSPLQVNAFISLLFGLLYIGAGIWYGTRYLIAGLVVFVLTLFAFYNLAEYFNLWMALAYGGTLVVTGLWMRRA